MAFYDWKKHSWLNIVIGFDQAFNAFFGILPPPFGWPGAGNPDKTISFTLGQLQFYNKGKIPWKYPIAKFFAFVCDTIDTDHCMKAFINGT